MREGLLAADDCKTLAADFALKNGGTPAQNADQLATFMVETGRLTDFQSRCVLADPPVDLRLGPFRVRNDQSPHPFSRWIEVERISPGPGGDAKRPSGERGYLIRTTADNPWLDAHAKISAPTLQPIVSEPMDEHVAVFSPLINLLDSAKTASSRPPDTASTLRCSESGPRVILRRACEYAMALADALAAMHEASLIHGGIRADRVWIGVDGKAILLRDPAGPAVTGLGDTTSQWLDTSDDPARLRCSRTDARPGRFNPMHRSERHLQPGLPDLSVGFGKVSLRSSDDRRNFGIASQTNATGNSPGHGDGRRG